MDLLLFLVVGLLPPWELAGLKQITTNTFQISTVKQNQEGWNTEQISFIHDSLFPPPLEFDTNYYVLQIIQSYQSSTRCPP